MTDQMMTSERAERQDKDEALEQDDPGSVFNERTQTASSSLELEIERVSQSVQRVQSLTACLLIVIMRRAGELNANIYCFFAQFIDHGDRAIRAILSSSFYSTLLLFLFLFPSCCSYAVRSGRIER